MHLNFWTTVMILKTVAVRYNRHLWMKEVDYLTYIMVMYIMATYRVDFYQNLNQGISFSKL